MPTRRQKTDGAEFRQEAFASAIEHERGVLANLVAARCVRLGDREVASVLWWLQQVSWREGGLLKLAQVILAENPLIVGTPSMHKIGRRPGTVYDAEQVRQIRTELKSPGSLLFDFPLRGERSRAERADAINAKIRARQHSEFCYAREADDICQNKIENPDSYPVERFLLSCGVDEDYLAAEMQRWLVDPATIPTNSLWNVPSLWQALLARRNHEALEASQQIVETEISRRVFEELDFALEARAFVLIEGREGIGKSEAARVWTEAHPGRAIYVRLESGSDETTLYRSIARKIGTACSYQRKAVEMRARIQDAMQAGQLMLVLDEAHFLWPQSGRSERTVPKRLDWLRTALIDFDVPVALVSTPQYFSHQCNRFREAGWNSLQIQRRLARTTLLPEPEKMDTKDFVAVAQHYFPEADDRTLKRIAALALGSVSLFGGIKHLRQRVDFVCARQPDLPRPRAITAELRAAGIPVPDEDSRAPQGPVKPSLRQASADFPDALRDRGAPSPGLIVAADSVPV